MARFDTPPFGSSTKEYRAISLYLTSMENPGRLLWFTNTQQDESERRLLDALRAYHPAAVRLTGNDTQFSSVINQDTIVLNLKLLDAEVFTYIEDIRAHAAQAVVIVRAAGVVQSERDSPGGIDAGHFLDAQEETQRAKTRIVNAMCGRRNEPPPPPAPEWRGTLIGESLPLQRVAEVIRLVGPRQCTVLITGETGTGKEIVARAIHQAGDRVSGPFVAVNCSAIPAALLEAELFGHTKGAFTGATEARKGRFEQAIGGTLFLDEIGDLPLELQPKLLRVLQEKTFQKLGSSETIRSNARVVAATNCDIGAKVRNGSFRSDLLYRLNVVPLNIPPLRERRGDIRLLTEHFLAKICRDEQLPPKLLTQSAWAALHQQEWHGNVRQLEHAIASAVILSENRGQLDVDDFPFPALEGAALSHLPSGVEVPEYGFDFTGVMNTLERSILAQALHKTGGNKKLAAEMLGLKRTTLSAKVRALEDSHGLRLN